MKFKGFTLMLALIGASMNLNAQTSPAANHLVLSEIGAAVPGDGEFTEIYNPTGAAINLSNYYISDHNLYFDLASFVAGNITNTLQNGSDHLVRLPNITIPSGGVVVVCYQAQNFLNVYFGGDLAKFTGLPGSPQLVEVNETRSDVPNVAANYNRSSASYPLSDPVTPAASGNNLNHTDGNESTVLFYWDGNSSLVKDVDMMQYSPKDVPPTVSNMLMNSPKSGQPEQGPSGIMQDYAFDYGTNENLTVFFPEPSPGETGSGNFVRHSLLEPGEILTGGNGINGHDETMEDVNLTWKIVYGSASNGSPGLVDMGKSSENQPPVLGFAQRSIQYPTPGQTIHVTCPVYDDGTVTVRLMVAKGNGAYVATTMTNEGNNVYGADISTAGLAEGTLVRYYVEATDSANLKSRETDVTFRNIPWVGIHTVMVKTGTIDPNSIIVSEVMYNPQGANNTRNSQYVELYNPATTELDISGYFIRSNYTDTDGATTPTLLRPNNIVVPDGIKIPAKGYVVLAGQKDVLWRRYPLNDTSRIIDVDIEPSRSFIAHAGSTLYFFGPNEYDFNDMSIEDVDNSQAFKTFAYQNNANGWPQGSTSTSIPADQRAGDTGYSIELKALVPGTENVGSNWAVSKFYQGSPLADNGVDTTLRPGDVSVDQPTRSIVNPGPSDTITIATTVASSTPVANVNLYYSVNGGSFSAVAMPNTSGNQYAGTLSGLPDNSLIRYYVEAADTSGNKGTYPKIAPVAIIPFRVESVSSAVNLKINEIMFNPQGTDNKTYPEYFEIYNAGTTPVDLSYYQYAPNLTQLTMGENVARLIPAGSILPPGKMFVISSRRTLFTKNYTSPFKSTARALYGEIDLGLSAHASWGWGTSYLVNGGGDMYIMHPNAVDYSGDTAGTPSLSQSYTGSTSGGWPGAGGNASIELKVVGTDPTIGSNWAFSKPWNGTPQVWNSVSPPPSGVSDWTLY